MKTKTSGFTLIELLVVIAIIAILAAILFPVFATAREKSRQSSCASNLKQLGLGFAQYTADYDEFLPIGWAAGTGIGWAGQIYPYVKSVGVFQCSDDSQSGDAFYLTNYPHGSYAYNEALVKLPTNVQPNLGSFTAPAVTVNLYEVAYSASTLNSTTYTDNTSCAGFGMYFDAGQSSHLYGVNQAGNQPGSYNTSAKTFNSGSDCTEDTGQLGQKLADNQAYGWFRWPMQATGRHSNGSNFLMCDGHVKWFLGTLVSPGCAAIASTNAENAVGGQGYCGWNAKQAAGTQGLGTYAVTFSPI